MIGYYTIIRLGILHSRAIPSHFAANTAIFNLCQVRSLIGAIVGSVITLVYTNWHEKFALEKEKRILQEALLGECQLQMALLERLDNQYAQ